jgi:hypothetical protein
MLYKYYFAKLTLTYWNYSQSNTKLTESLRTDLHFRLLVRHAKNTACGLVFVRYVSRCNLPTLLWLRGQLRGTFRSFHG